MKSSAKERVIIGKKLGEKLRAVWRNKRMSVEVMKGMYETTALLTTKCGSET